MGRVSIEIVPRDGESFTEELKLVNERFPSIKTINIPDILKFDMRIPEACEYAGPYFPEIIPHIRAVSVNREKPFTYKEFFEKNGIKEVLVILGDNPEIVQKSSCPCTSVELISKIKKEMPYMKVYGGMDPYRTSLKEELDYVKEKKDAGADGFFTQPFFDIDFMKTCRDKLGNTEIFWGLAPVIRESAKRYWENDNKISFPEGFEMTFDWNRDFAREVLDFTKESDSNAYFMPITVDVVEYLGGIL